MSAPAVVVLTGAGISADSGLATFRGADGLWEGYRLEDVATPEAWRRDPAVVWRFYQMRRAQLAEVQPNDAHRALVVLERAVLAAGGTFSLVSQNVDDLHQRVGSAVLDMHGQLARLACERCGHTLEDREHLDPERFVPCPSCGYERLRPDVVWFGEIPRYMDAIQDAVARCTHFVSIGTSGVVYPAAGLLAWARTAGAATFVQSLDEPDNLDPRDVFAGGRAVDVLPGLVGTWTKSWSS